MSPFTNTDDMGLLLGTLTQVEAAAGIHDETNFVVGIRIGVGASILDDILGQRLLFHG